MNVTILSITAVSVTIEISDIDSYNSAYYSLQTFNVYLNGNKIRELENHNVISIFDLTPNTDYELTIINNNKNNRVRFKTLSTKETVLIKYQDGDMTKIIQKIIDTIPEDSLIIIEPGEYHITPLFLRSKQTIYFKKGCHIIGEKNRDLYPVLSEDDGTWEGLPSKMFASLFTGLYVNNVTLVGEGIIDGNAQNSDWWINHKVIRGGSRPNLLFLNHCEKINVIGLTWQNSPCWTLHPYYTKQIAFYNNKVINPKVSPNTDGCNPESCTKVSIIGCHFSVGDDCIAIKAGKQEMVTKEYQPCSEINISNCLMENGHGAVVLGSEMSCGIKDLSVRNCLFIATDRGLRIKTRRGRGKLAIIDKIIFEEIKMIDVLNPFVINMFYYCDEDGKSDYVQCKESLPVDDRTPYLGEFIFRNIDCENAVISAGFFYGLPEQKIKKITFENVKVTMRDNLLYDIPAMMSGIEKVNQIGCYLNNIEQVVIKDLSISKQKGLALIINNVNKIKEK